MRYLVWVGMQGSCSGREENPDLGAHPLMFKMQGKDMNKEDAAMAKLGKHYYLQYLIVDNTGSPN